MHSSTLLSTAALLCAAWLPCSLAGSADARALEVGRGDAELELRVHDPRGGDYDSAFESVVELRKAGRRVHRRKLSFGVRRAALHDDGRIVLAGESLREAHGLRADVSVLCFLDVDGNTTAVHEVSTPRRPRRRVAHGTMLCGALTPPPPPFSPWRTDDLLPLAAGRSLAVDSRRFDGEREVRWRVFDEAGDMLGTLDTLALLSSDAQDTYMTSACVLPGTQVVVATWMTMKQAGDVRMLTVHDLSTRFGPEAKPSSLGPLHTVALEGSLFYAYAVVESGGDPRVEVRDRAQRARPRGYVVRGGPDGEVRVQRLEGDD